MSFHASGAPRILLIDSNVYFSKRVSDALQQVGFEVTVSTQAAYALTMLEWNTPTAILCATNLREMGALEMAPILRADAKTANIPLIAVGGADARALLEAYGAGCDDFVDRRRSPADIAAHVRSFLVSRQEGFQPTQMLPTSDTALSGNLSHLDLPGVIQMLGQARQTGALHVNAGDTDGIIFFGGGEIVHAESGALFGDEAVTQIVRTCQGTGKGVYKFVYGASAAQRTVLRSSTDLLLDAMRELDELARDYAEDSALYAAHGADHDTSDTLDHETDHNSQHGVAGAHLESHDEVHNHDHEAIADEIEPHSVEKEST